MIRILDILMILEGMSWEKEKKVFDFEVEMIKKRREDAIRKIIEDSKSLKW